jgi:hypothetical protein
MSLIFLCSTFLAPSNGTSPALSEFGYLLWNLGGFIAAVSIPAEIMRSNAYRQTQCAALNRTVSDCFDEQSEQKKFLFTN